MKNRFLPLIALMVLSFFTLSKVNAQNCDIPAPFEGNTGVNMTMMLLPSFVQSLPVSGTAAYMVVKTPSGMVVGSTEVNGSDQTSLTIWGDDTFTPEVDGALSGDAISFALVEGANIYDVSPIFGMGGSNFTVNGIASIVNSTSVSVCSSQDADVFGCTGESACNFDSTATQDDGSCVYAESSYDCSGACLNDVDDDGVCDEFETLDCLLPSAFVGNTGSNMTVMLLPPFINSLPISNPDAYLVAKTLDGVVVGSEKVATVSKTSIAVWGDDTSTSEIDGALANADISFQLVDGVDLYDVDMPFPISYTANGMAVQSVGATSVLNCSSSGLNEILACELGVVYITEAHGKGDPEDYIEIYNSGDEECTLLGFMLDDEQPFGDLTFGDVVIAPGAYWVGEEDAEGSFGSGIGGGGDSLYLGDTQGNVLVVASLDGDLGGTSFTADGTGCSATPSPGLVNNACTVFIEGCTDPTATNYNAEANLEDDSCEYVAVVPACVLGTVYITEAHGKGDPEDYIEIYNSGDEECTLLGFMLDDEQPFDDLTFGDVVIAPGAYWLGEEDAEGSFGSGIGGGGDSLYLGDDQGNYLVVASLDGDLGATNFTADGTECSATPSPGFANNACTVFVEGCTDETAVNYNTEANLEDDSCQYDVFGCTDDVSDNFDPNATQDDGSCEVYEQEECPILDFSFVNTGSNMTILFTSSFVSSVDLASGTQIGVFAVDESGENSVCFGSTVWTGSQISIAAMGNDETSDVIDGFAQGDTMRIGYQLSDGVIMALDSDYFYTTNNIEYIVSGTFGPACDAYSDNTSLGCTDPTATNYNAEANLEDDSCQYDVFGCTDDVSDNFDPNATQDDGSCEVYEQEECPILDFSFVNTGSNMTILFTSSFVSSVDLASGTQIGVFAVDESGENPVCFGSTVWTGSQISIAAMGNDETSDVIDGFAQGDTMRIGYQLSDGVIMALDSDYFYTTNNIEYIVSGTFGPACDAYSDNTSLGCTDPTATNYNAEANLEDDSCEYVAVVPACVLGTVYITEAHGKGDPEDYIEIYNSGDTDCTLLGFMLDDEQPFGDLTFGDVVIAPGVYWLGEEDAEGSFGSGIGGGGDNLYLGDTEGNVLMVASLDGDLGATNFTADGTGCSATPSPGFANNACTVFIQGCTDDTAVNYNTEANLEDDSCEYEIFGCTDDASDNFDPNATQDDGSCEVYEQEECPILDFSFVNTGSNMTILFTSSFVSSVDLASGTQIGVFAVDESGENPVCFGSTVWTGSQISIAAMGNDETSDEIDGFAEGDTIYIGYQLNDGLVMGLSEEYIYSTNGIQLIESGVFEPICDPSIQEVLGCSDAAATNYDSAATVPGQDQYGNSVCVYASCDDIPDAEGCIYVNAYAPYNEFFSPSDCASYGGTACVEPVIGVNGVVFSGAFGGTYAQGNVYTSPSGSESWGGFANEDLSLYPLMFQGGGSISFDAISDDPAEIYFRFEKNPHPDTEPSFNTESVFVDGSASFTVDLPSQGLNTFSSFLLYVVTKDVAITLNNVSVSTTGSPTVDVPGCMDSKATNYSSNATMSAQDSYGNSVCIYASCDDIPDTEGCLYIDAYAPYNEFFSPDDCASYGGTTCGAEPGGDVEGCTNVNANNYNSDATLDDGSCEYGTYGCMDPAYVEYDINATLDDASCSTLIVEGCTNENFVEYNADANKENGTCFTFVFKGCTDVAYMEFNPNATQDDGSCETLGLYGCTNPLFLEFNPNANIENGTCLNFLIFGCIQPDAFNFNPNANKGDGSCIDKIFGCTLSQAFNYDATANVNNGSCEPFKYGCINLSSFNYNPNANTSDGSCIPFVTGCTDPNAINYNSLANSNDGSCEAVIYGCIDFEAFNYNPNANKDNGGCIPKIEGCMSDMAFNYNPLANINDGSCILKIEGCTIETAFNFNPNANSDNGMCIETVRGCTNPNAVNYNVNANVNDGSCQREVFGCADASAFNYNPNANTDDGSCMPAVKGCTNPVAFNYNSLANINDGSCESKVLGCTDPSAFNYNPNANTEFSTSTCISLIYGCTNSLAFNFDPIATMNDGSCVAVVRGCMDETALNYNPNANTDNSSCVAKVAGCMNPLAKNYNPSATMNDGSCISVLKGCTNPEALNYFPSANTDDGSCITLVEGCMNAAAMNYNPNANFNDGSCLPFIYGCMDESALNYYLFANTDDGSCINKVAGCTNPLSLNYNALANVNDASCIAKIFGCTDDSSLNFSSVANTDDGSCIDVVEGCTNPLALNYNAAANFNDASCIAKILGCTNSEALNYYANANEDDGSCLTKVVGCTNALAFNYNPDANFNNNSCLPVIFGCMDDAAINYQVLANTPDNSCKSTVSGCMNPMAYNYTPEANTNDGSCTAKIAGCMDEDKSNYNPEANVAGVCIDVVYGCIYNFPFITNYNPEATVNQESAVDSGDPCEYSFRRRNSNKVCTDPIAENYFPMADSNNDSYNETIALQLDIDNETCTFIEGCTDGLAFNYNADATKDDGTCIDVVAGCMDDTYTEYNASANTDTDPTSCETLVVEGCTDLNAFNYDASANTNDGSCTAIVYGCLDNSYVEFNASANTDTDPTSCVNEVVSGCTDEAYLEYNASANTSDVTACVTTAVVGCMDDNFTEYNASANKDTDPTSCATAVVNGCTDLNAFNYEANANTNDGSCLDIVYGCMDANYVEFNASANTDTDPTSCANEVVSGCTDSDYVEYNASANSSDESACVTIAVTGCMDDAYTEYSALANVDDGSCATAVVRGCTDLNAFNFDSNANVNDGSCLAIVYGCSDDTYLEYDASANTDNGSCVNVTVLGCTDSDYLEYSASANKDDDSCSTLIVLGCMNDAYTEYNASANTDTDPSTCQTLIVSGCTDVNYTEFDSSANTNDGSCATLIVEGCTDDTYLEHWDYNTSDKSITALTNVPDTDTNPTSCINLIVNGCTNFDYDEYNELANVDDGSCTTQNVTYGCMDSTAENYDASATDDSQSTCIYLVPGCTNSLSSNYNAEATQDDGSCEAVVVLGCMTSTAANYNPLATQDDGSCEVFVLGCTDETSFNYNSNANKDDGTCIAIETGCTNATAFNYNSLANTDDGSCEAVVNGCTDEAAYNYNALANTEDNSCVAIVSGCTDEAASNYNSLANTDDDSCIIEIVGCMDEDACNYDASANTNVGCEYTEAFYDCNDVCISDVDTDGICDELEVSGCTDSLYFEFNSLATDDDASCTTIIVLGCTDATAFNYDESANTNDDTCVDLVSGCMDDTYVEYNPNANTSDDSCSNKVILGCMNENALNYSSLANKDDGLCILPVGGCTDVNACNYNTEANVDDASCLIPEGCEYCSGETDGSGTLITNEVDPNGGCVSLEESESIGMKIYPNPASDLVTISNLDFETITIYGLSGQMLQWNQNYDGQIDISNLSSGIYTLKLTDVDGNQHYSKLIKK